MEVEEESDEEMGDADSDVDADAEVDTHVDGGVDSDADAEEAEDTPMDTPPQKNLTSGNEDEEEEVEPDHYWGEGKVPVFKPVRHMLTATNHLYL